MSIDVQVKQVRNSTPLPAYATAGAAGMDLRAALDNELVLAPGERALVPTGIALQIPNGYVGLVFARSGLASRHGIALANGVGVIDADYRGEVLCALQNNSSAPYTVTPGDRVAQLAFIPVAHARLVPVADLTDTARGEGGFGSTGE